MTYVAGHASSPAEEYAWAAAPPHVRALIVAARVHGFGVVLAEVTVTETEVQACWNIVTQNLVAVRLYSDGVLQVVERYTGARFAVHERMHRVELTERTWPWVVKNVLSPRRKEMIA